jgi:hypothetical protein
LPELLKWLAHLPMVISSRNMLRWTGLTIDDMQYILASSHHRMKKEQSFVGYLKVLVKEVFKSFQHRGGWSRVYISSSMGDLQGRVADSQMV